MARVAAIPAVLGWLLFGVSQARYRAAADVQGSPPVHVLTYHNDNARTGANLNERILTPQNVNPEQFRKLFTYPVDGQVYAQPLYMSNVTIEGKGQRNVVFVATEHNSVYAFDADNYTDPLWHVNFNDEANGVTPVPTEDVLSGDLVPEIGITGTPVIDASTGTLYVVSKTKKTTEEGATYHQHLHALDVASGAEKFGGPVEIQASVRGTGDGSDNGMIPFHPLREHQRPGLALHNGIVYVTWASHGDNGPYHGWVIAYNARTLAMIDAWVTTPNGGLGGIWQSGAAPAIDEDGSLFFMTGNGTFTADVGGKDYSMCMIKLKLVRNKFRVLSYFGPYNLDPLNIADWDLGSGGVVILPYTVGSPANPKLVVGTGKEGRMYLVDRKYMGRFHAFGDFVVDAVSGVVGGQWSTPAFFNRTLYYGGVGDNLKAIGVRKARLGRVPFSKSADTFPYPGATPSVSANQSAPDPRPTGIVWVIRRTDGQAALQAYDALNLSRKLYDSSQTGGRDETGGYVKFSVPTVANGKVFVGTASGLVVFGLSESSGNQDRPQ